MGLERFDAVCAYCDGEALAGDVLFLLELLKATAPKVKACLAGEARDADNWLYVDPSGPPPVVRRH